MIGERKISNQSTTASTVGPCPTIIQITQIPRSPFSTIGQISRLSMNLMGTPTNMYNIRTVVKQGLLSALPKCACGRCGWASFDFLLTHLL